MGRKLRPLNPAAGVVEQFAYELRALRQGAGEQPFWKMARRCQVSKSALAAAAAGSTLPSDRVARAFVEVCGGDWTWWRRRLTAARTAQLAAGPLVREGSRPRALSGGPLEEVTVADASRIGRRHKEE
jgi:hypothetical protein